MWIVPKTLDTSLTALDTMASESDLNLLGSTLSSLFMWRSKPSPSGTWLRRWKREPWVRELSGRILKPSQSKDFEDVLISCLGVSPASLSAKQDTDKETKTLVTSSLTSSEESNQLNLDSSSLRMSKESSAPSSKEATGETQQERPFCSMSLESWSEWVIEQRQSRVARQKSALLISETGGSSSAWPTAASRDWKDSPGMAKEAVNPDGSLRKRTDQLARAVYGQADQDRNSTDGSHLESSGQLNPRWVETLMGIPVGWTMPRCAAPVRIEPTNLDSSETELYPLQPQKPSEEDLPSWPTTRTSDAEGGRIRTEQTAEGFRSHRVKSDQWFGAKLRDAVETYEENRSK